QGGGDVGGCGDAVRGFEIGWLLNFPQPSSQPQFKVQQAKEPREAKRKQKRTGKQPVVDLDEDDEHDEMALRRSITRWNNNEEILLAESWIEHSQDANIEKDQHEDIYWNMIMSDFNSRTTAPPHNLQELFGPDPRERLADKQRAKKKQKSIETTSHTKEDETTMEHSSLCSASEDDFQNQLRRCLVELTLQM
nr:hypothetical protein [Tanacetum cinerariifolium]